MTTNLKVGNIKKSDSNSQMLKRSPSNPTLDTLPIQTKSPSVSENALDSHTTDQSLTPVKHGMRQKLSFSKMAKNLLRSHKKIDGDPNVTKSTSHTATSSSFYVVNPIDSGPGSPVEFDKFGAKEQGINESTDQVSDDEVSTIGEFDNISKQVELMDLRVNQLDKILIEFIQATQKNMDTFHTNVQNMKYRFEELEKDLTQRIDILQEQTLIRKNRKSSEDSETSSHILPIEEYENPYVRNILFAFCTMVEMIQTVYGKLGPINSALIIFVVIIAWYLKGFLFKK